MNSSELENLVEYYRSGCLAHAYLITTNDMSKCMEVLLKVIKNIFCVNEYSDDCNKCSLCHLIDIKNLPSLKIIGPDGSTIKKEQILELKSIFAKESVYTNNQIYIIQNAEKMNKEAANTMLKFLEEPVGNVIGFFITNNKENVMLTIQSRCQNIICNFDTEDVYEFDKDTVYNYLKEIELSNDLILINKKYYPEIEKNELTNIFKYILQIYKTYYEDNLNSKKATELQFLKEFNKSKTEKKINLIIEILNKLSYNINVQLLLDSFVLEMDVINHEII